MLLWGVTVWWHCVTVSCDNCNLRKGVRWGKKKRDSVRRRSLGNRFQHVFRYASNSSNVAKFAVYLCIRTTLVLFLLGEVGVCFLNYAYRFRYFSHSVYLK